MLSKEKIKRKIDIDRELITGIQRGNIVETGALCAEIAVLLMCCSDNIPNLSRF